LLKEDLRDSLMERSINWLELTLLHTSISHLLQPLV
jgi:hypothetical protein